MTPKTITSELAKPAGTELRQLAAVMRPDWNADALAGAMAAAHSSGWSWARTFTEVARMLTDDRAEPRDLRDACRQPVEGRQAQDREAVERAAAVARSELARAVIEIDQHKAEAAAAGRAGRDAMLRDGAA